ncbi:glycosyltransferase family 2 protein, partial [Pseudodesulfovibrio sp.]|nr:glycosyltransferase family 2 protein [Pseudodesulfovibrio sp.]
MTHATYTPTDRFEELDLIDLDGVFDVLNIYCNNLLPDMEACLVFLLRILKDKDAASHPKTREWLPHLVRKVRDLGPLNPQGLNLAHKLTGDPALDARIERLNYFDLDPELLDFRSVMNAPAILERKRALLMDTLTKMPGHILAASQLLQLDSYQGIDHAEWLDTFTVPKFFQDEWKHRLFLHYAGLGITDKAMALWPAISSGPISEIHLNLAAELFARTGDTQQALDLYGRSLEIDPNQTPVQLRMAELENPTQADHALLAQKSVTICLYSWNKADDLERTLASLAQTDIGAATIRVLLNGCTDRSAEVV